MLQDLKHAIHELRRSPAFTAVAVLTLALGIGANTAIFGVVNRVMLSPLPYPQAERFVYLSLSYQQGPLGMFVTIAPDVARDWLGAPSLEAAAAFSTHDFLAYDDRGARIVHGLAVTDGLPAFLGVQPVLGRAFSADDARPGAPPTVLLSYAMWQRDYGGAPDVLGRAITLDDVSRTVIGVMPARADAFAPAQASADVWLPLSLDTGPGAARGSDAIQVIARLRAGVSADTAARELNDLAERVWENRPAPRPDLKLVTRVRSSSDVFVQAGTRDGLVVLLGAVGAVLLVACANVANLLLARGAARSRDIALRAALGASGWRLVRQLLTECFVLALAAGVVGVALGWLMLRVIVPLRPRGLLDLSDIHLDPTVLAFTFGLSLVTAVVFGLVPALHVIPSTLGRALRHGGGGSGVVRGGGLRLRRLLVAGEMALCVILLVSAALLVRSIVYLQRIDVGYDTHNLFAARLSLPLARYQTPQSRDLFMQEMLERLRGIPGVASATAAFMSPPSMAIIFGVRIDGAAPSEADASTRYAMNYVQPGYFATVGIHMLEGRAFTPAEMDSGAAVVINRSAARHFWPGQSAIGRRLQAIGKSLTVVAVVEDAAAGGLIVADKHTPQLYFPYRSDKVPGMLGQPPEQVYIVRAKSDPAPVIAALRAATRAIDAEVAIRDITLTDTALASSIDGPRFNMALLTAFAVLAVVLAAVGLAAVTSYGVVERTHEIGIRMALGARQGNVLGLVVKQAMATAVAGTALGVLGALAATRLLSTLIYGVAPRDPGTFVGVSVLLLGVALAASLVAARRATRVDPMAALRAE